MVISSSSPAVAARCAHARPRVGVAASQNITDPRLGPALLAAVAGGASAASAVDEVVDAAAHIELRQLSVLDAGGVGAAYTGAGALGVSGHRLGGGCVAAGNLLASEAVLDAMIEAFGSAGDLGDRLVGALTAAMEAGGEAGPVHSAGLLMVGDVAWPVADLRVDWHERPIEELGRVWDVYRPQLDDYIVRALDPTSAPGYGVPGE
jgi:uncharacterized Ntn-hydrolase superfamily protein